MRAIVAGAALLLLGLSPLLWELPGRADQSPVFELKRGLDPNFSLDEVETSRTLDGRVLIVRARHGGLGSSGESMLSLSQALVLTEVTISEQLDPGQRVTADSAILDGEQIWIVGKHEVESGAGRRQGFTTRAGLIIRDGHIDVAPGK